MNLKNYVGLRSITLSAVLIACISVPNVLADTYQEIAWMSKGKESVRLKLKDPDSAEFKKVFFSDSSGVPMTCGEVLAKNSFGGYSGYQRFISAGNSKLTFLEEAVSDFENLWNKVCR